MKLLAFKRLLLKELASNFDGEEIVRFYYVLCAHFLKMNRAEVVLKADENIPPQAMEMLDSALSKLKINTPIQYVLGETDFYGSTFRVNQDVLIPRPETEELVDWIIKEYQNKSVKILDIGTGSGCIAISLAKHIQNAMVYAMDISESALKIAQENAKINQVDLKIWQQSILELDALIEKFDVIVSNPPYVRYLEKEQMHKNVLEHEPSLALFVEDNDPLLFYRKIAALAKVSLNAGGVLFFEINQYLGNETRSLLKDLGYESVTLKKDMFGNDRMIKAQLFIP
ncbi:MAG: peptide chain release factor N(5)-glutamine methyltransferase [Flavobacterium sp.]